MFGIKTRLKTLLRTRATLRSINRIIRDEYGQLQSLKKSECLDKNGNHTPWFTYPAIEYLNQIDLTGKRVLEFGSGYSTLYWARRTAGVVSIEDSKSWYESMRPRLPKNVEYVHAATEADYVKAAGAAQGQFDIIVNDGLYRYDCATASRAKLAPGGFVIVDNADWCARTCAFYRDSDLIEVDMAGFLPLNAYPMTTSFFFSRDVRLKPANAIQPTLAVGGEVVTAEDLDTYIKG